MYALYFVHRWYAMPSAAAGASAKPDGARAICTGAARHGMAVLEAAAVAVVEAVVVVGGVVGVGAVGVVGGVDAGPAAVVFDEVDSDVEVVAVERVAVVVFVVFVFAS